MVSSRPTLIILEGDVTKVMGPTTVGAGGGPAVGVAGSGQSNETALAAFFNNLLKTKSGAPGVAPSAVPGGGLSSNGPATVDDGKDSG